MQKNKQEFSVKLLGSENNSEIRRHLPRWVQNPYTVYCFKNGLNGKAASKAWNSLSEEEKAPFFETSNKQKSLQKDIKELAKKQFSLIQALNEVDSSLNLLKENFSALVVKKPRVKRLNAFEKFSQEWLQKNPDSGTQDEKKNLIKKAWAELSKSQKSQCNKISN